MKQFWAIFAIFFALTLPLEAHAKRMGGGKSFGRTHQTAPAQPTRNDAAPTQRNQADNKAAPAKSAAGKGMMGGLLGGLLAGGLLAALFMGGAFDNIQIMDILIIAILAFVIFKVIQMMRNRNAPSAPQRPAPHAYAPAGAPMPPQEPEQQPMARNAFGNASSATSHVDAVPFNLPMDFDSAAFLDGAKEHYTVLQSAWNDNNLNKIEEYVTPELFDALRVERASLPAKQSTEILSVNAELVRADQVFGNAEVSIQFSGRYRDAAEGVEENFIDIWHLERDYSKADAPWFITGIESK